MNEIDDKYVSLINKLKENKPLLANPEKLTNDIMASVETAKINRFNRVMVIARPWISIAAVFLIVLFIFQQTNIPQQQSQTVGISTNKSNYVLSHCLFSFLSEKENKSFFTSYFCYLKQTEQKNKSSDQLILKIQNRL